MAAMYSKGLRVRMPKRAEWGIGEVVADSVADKVKVFFEHAGEKTFSTSIVMLEKVEGDAAQSTALDNRAAPHPMIAFRSLQASIDDFLARYDAGFYGDFYLADERKYKVEAAKLLNESLSNSEMAPLIAAGDFQEIVTRALRVMNKVNFAASFEKIQMRNAMEDARHQARFAKGLHNLLHGVDDDSKRFQEFCDTMTEIDAAKWPLVTTFLFLARPDEHMLVKPTSLQEAAAVCQFEIGYRTEPNWKTYSQILLFARDLQKKIALLRPRDMIDVQGFIWCIYPEAEAMAAKARARSKKPRKDIEAH